MSRTWQKNKHKPIHDKYLTAEGNCIHCGNFIGNNDSRILRNQGHDNGTCKTQWKKTRYLESQGLSGSNSAKRARPIDDNSGATLEVEGATEGTFPLLPQEGLSPAAAADDLLGYEPSSSESEYTEGGTCVAKSESLDLEDDESGSEDDRHSEEKLDDGGITQSVPEAIYASEDEYLFSTATVDASRPPRFVEDYQARLKEPIYEGADVTLVEWLVRSVELRGTTSREGFEHTWKHHVQHYKQPNICPTSWYMCKRVLGIKHFDDHVYHFCVCDEFRYDQLQDSSQETYRTCRQQKCGVCGESRFEENASGHLVPRRWAFYIPLDIVLKEYLFANPNFTEAIGKGRPSEGEASSSLFAGSSFWGSPAYNAINDYFEEHGQEKSRELESKHNSPYSIFLDFFQAWQKKSYSTGALLLKCEDLTLEDRGRLEFSPVVMIIPGPKKPKFAAPYLELIGRDFAKFSFGGKGIFIDKAVKRAEDGTLTRMPSFYHRPVLIGLDADTPAGQFVLEAMQSSGAYVVCFKCKLNGQRNPEDGKNGMVYFGYAKPAPAHRGLGKGESFQMGVDDDKRRLTPAEYEQRIKNAVGEEDRQKVRALHGIYDDCVLRKCLPYIDYRWFVRLPISHCLLFGIVKLFWRLILRWQGANKGYLPENKISLSPADINKLKSAMKAGSIKAHCDFNRPFGGLDTMGTWEMEDWMRWTEIYSTFVRKDVVGVELNDVAFQMWHHLRKAVMHYMYGTDASDYEQSVRDVAYENLLAFGKLAEEHIPEMCLSNLHRACCWLPGQETWLGLVAFFNELWGERGLRPLKRASLNKVTTYPEKTQANAVLQQGRVNITRAAFAVQEGGEVEENNGEDDVGMALRTRSRNRAEKERENYVGRGDAWDDASGTEGLIGKGELLKEGSNNEDLQRLFEIASAALRQLGLENDVDWNTLYCHSRAVLGVVECVHSTRYKRVVSRDSTLVKIRYDDESSRNIAGPWIAKVQFFLRCKSLKEDKVIRLAICNFYKRAAGGELEVGVEGRRTAKAALKARTVDKIEHVWVAEIGRNGEEDWNDVHYAEYLDKIDTKVISFVGQGEQKSKMFFQKASFHSKV